jgi:hypothetical protein
MHKVTHGAPFSSTTFTTTIQHQPDSTDEENRLRRESPPPLASVSKHFDAQHVVFYALSCRTPLYRYPFVPQLLLRPSACDFGHQSSENSWDLAPSSCISKSCRASTLSAIQLSIARQLQPLPPRDVCGNFLIIVDIAHPLFVPSRRSRFIKPDAQGWLLICAEANSDNHESSLCVNRHRPSQIWLPFRPPLLFSSLAQSYLLSHRESISRTPIRYVS